MNKKKNTNKTVRKSYHHAICILMTKDHEIIPGIFLMMQGPESIPGNICSYDTGS